MARYLLLWDVDTSRTAEDLDDRRSQQRGFQDIVRQQIKDGEIVDYGAFVGETAGYAVVDGSAEDVHKLVLRWIPWVSFETRQLLSIEQVIEATEAM